MRALVLVLLLAGCAAPAAPPEALGASAEGAAATAWTVLDVALSCTERGSLDRAACFEPTVAWRDGTLVVTERANPSLAVLAAQGPDARDVPPPPPGHHLLGDDLVLADTEGRLWYSTLTSAPVQSSAHPLLFSGALVAWSRDAGASWAVVSFHSLTDGGAPDLAYAPDRQWVTPAPDGAVYLTYQVPGLGVFVARSDDEARTFGPPVLALGHLEHRRGSSSGPPAVLADGTLVLPYFASLERRPDGALVANAVGLVRSSDRGASWSAEVVARLAGAEAALEGTWPGFAVGPDGALHLAWTTVGGDVVVARSADGSAWERVRWRAGPEGARWTPWVDALPDGRLAVAWFGAAGPSHEVGAAVGAFADLPAAAATLAVVDGAHPFTHFAHLAAAPEGRVAVAWAEETRVRVAVLGATS